MFNQVEELLQKVIDPSFLELVVSDGLALILEEKSAYTNDIALESGYAYTSITSLHDKMKIIEDLNIYPSLLKCGVSSSGLQRKRKKRNIPYQKQIVYLSKAR